MELTRTPDVETPALTFVPEGFHPTDTAALEGLVGQLLEREPADVGGLRQWIYDWSELSSVVYAEYTRLFTAMHRDTKDDDAKERNLAYQRDVLPLYQSLNNKLNRKLLASSYLSEVGKEFDLLIRDLREEAELFREENTKLGAEDRALGARFSELQGKLEVELRGEKLTVQQAGAKIADQDRGLREDAFRALVAARGAIVEIREGS